MEDALEELGELWAELKKRHQENGKALQEIDTVSSSHPWKQYFILPFSFAIVQQVLCMFPLQSWMWKWKQGNVPC